MRIPLSRPDIGEREIELVTRALRSGQLTLGPCLTEFEEKFAAYAGRRYAVSTNSGTSALHLGAKALGIGPQDDVLTSAFSFVASASTDPLSLSISIRQHSISTRRQSNARSRVTTPGIPGGASLSTGDQDTC